MDHSPVWRAIVVGILRPLLFLLLRRDWRAKDKIPRTGGVIIAANHLSWSDPLALAHFVYKAGRFPVYLAKDAVFKVPVIGRILRRTGQIPVYRERADAGLALRDAEKALRGGECVVFYPEGTCTRDPALWPMTGKTGVARLALITGTKVVPVAHWGAQELWPYGTKNFRPFPPKTMHVIAGDPVDLSKYANEPLNAATLEAATADIMRAIADLLGELRGETPPETLYDHHQVVRAKRALDTAAADDPPKTDPPKTDPPKTGAPKTEAPRNEAPRNEAPRNEAPRNGTAKNDAGADGDTGTDGGASVAGDPASGKEAKAS